MGGPGSGRWYRFEAPKATVEECRTISVSDLRKRLSPGATGTFTWRFDDGRAWPVTYRVVADGVGLRVLLDYELDGEKVLISVAVETVVMRFGGRRAWLRCPLVIDGRACRRRVAKLHLPPGARFFGCRKCHNLTYVSTQTAHALERSLAHLGLHDKEAIDNWRRYRRDAG